MNLLMPRLLILPALAALLALAVPAAPASAQAGPACACADGFPLEEPDFCYEAPGSRIADFAYNFPSDLLQVVGFGATRGYCRHNASFTWIDGPGTLACEEFIGCLCDNPNPGPEVLCNGDDDDCDPGTPDEPSGECVAAASGECVNGALACDAGAVVCEPGLPVTEVCDNGLDDDCDGAVDGGDTDCDECAGGVRFVDRGLTVFDCQTRLEWEKKTFGNVADGGTWTITGSAPDGTLFSVLLPAVAAALGGTACDHTAWSCTSGDDATRTCTTEPPSGCWRIPEFDELGTINDAGRPGCGMNPYTIPCIDPIFGPTAVSNYWSATSHSNPLGAWIADTINGILASRGKGNNFRGRAVRSIP